MFCPLPWIAQAIRNNGDIRVCCQANQGPDRGLIRKDDGSIYNASIDSLVECRNAQKMKDIRLSILNHEWHPDCIRCEREDKSNIRARCTYETELWNHYFTEQDARRVTKADGSINPKEVPLVYYDLRFGNKCNLKCRSCGPTDSDAWYEDQVKLWNEITYYDTTEQVELVQVNGKYKPKHNIYNWYKNNNFWNHLNQEIPNIRHVYMVGGEPLLINEQFDFLKQCIESGHSNNIAIEYNSNIVTIPNKAWELWKYFKAIKMGSSIDGIGKVNEYIRYPSKWKTIEKNLRLLDNAKGNFQIWMAVTVQALNILHLPELFQWKMDQNFKRVNPAEWQPVVTLHPLHSPHFLNAKVLPLDVKKKIHKKFESYQFMKHNEHAHKLLSQYSNYMFQEDYSHLLEKFWEYNTKLDEIRGQSFRESIPELFELLRS